MILHDYSINVKGHYNDDKLIMFTGRITYTSKNYKNREIDNSSDNFGGFMIKNINNLKIMSYNIHSGKNLFLKPTLKDIIQFMADYQGQVIGIQEINENEKRGRQVSSIINSLQLNHSFAPNVSLAKGYYGVATFTSLPILENHHILLPSEKEQRGLLHTVLSLGNDKIHILNTHLGLSERERSQQFYFIREYVANLNSPIILMGDFNTKHPDLQGIPLLDAAEISNQKHIPTFIPTRQRIDYIFLSPSINLLEYQVAPVTFSDHYPLSVRVALRSFPNTDRQLYPHH